MKEIFTALLFLFIALPHLNAQTNLSTRAIVTNLDTPWEILWGPDDFIWFTERPGKISRVNPDTGEIFEVLTITDVAETSEGGLLGMVLDPDFAENNYFYVAYNYFASENDYREKIVRLIYDPSTGKAGSSYILFDNIDANNNHNGCRLIITPDKKLILTTGDAQNTSNAQDINKLNGKTLRINLDGTIPADNPFQNNPVWTWGHRNPQGLVYSPDSTILYSSEHGPSSDDEINIITKGGNYGWPEVLGFCDTELENAFCLDSNVVEPIFAWTPTLAVAGIDFYNSDLIPEWKNSILVPSLKASKITQLLLDESKTSVINSADFFTDVFGRLRDICVSPGGKVYVAVSNRDGRGSPQTDDDKIIEIAPVATSISKVKENNFINISPNPARSFINITFPRLLKTTARYTFYNISGQTLKTGNMEPSSTKLYLPADYEGITILKINIDNQVITRKIIVRK